MSARRPVDHVRLRYLLATHKGTGRTLDSIAREIGASSTAVRKAVQRLRQGEPDVWPTDDARLREDALTGRLVRNAGRNIHPDCYQATELQRLRQVSRLRAGLPLAGRGDEEGTARRWEARLLKPDNRRVIDLDAEGRPFERAAHAWERDIICSPEAGALLGLVGPRSDYLNYFFLGGLRLVSVPFFLISSIFFSENRSSPRR